MWYSYCYTRVYTFEMIICRPGKKQSFGLLLILFLTLSLTFESCKKHNRHIGEILFKKTQNNVFKKLDDDEFDAVFKRVLDSESSKLNYPHVINIWYSQHNYDPSLLLNSLQNNDLASIADYYDKSTEHGFDPKVFHGDEIRSLAAKFYDKTAIKNPNEAYHDIAELELLIANSFIKYSNYLQYGIINPKNIYARYYTVTKRPDSASMLHVLAVKDVRAYLDSIQPKDPQYVALQKAYLGNTVLPGTSLEETKRILLVNMERLRWKNKPTEPKYVLVNIPDFHLDVIDSGHSVLGMKVCVGQGRNMDYAKNLMHYDDTDKVDKPQPHSTPQLNSVIHSVQVNPIWNIPESIANKEIIVEAAKDPYYLSNKNIDVYKNDKKVPDPDSIKWDQVDKSEYSFKQEPGEDNSLGKIKFLFENESNVYLHDTPAKSAFYEKMRAVSHGCVRLGDPQALALNLFGAGDKYDTITKDMAADNPDPTTIYLPRKTPVYITYVTCWADSNGTLQYRPDVYGLDIVLYANLAAK